MEMQQPPDTPQDVQAKKRKTRRPKHLKQVAQADGAVSDSALPAMPTPQRQQAQNTRHQSVAIPVQPAKQHAQKQQRPVSMGSSMFPATPAKEQAYAGSKFQDSPAPSALPKPSKFGLGMVSRSVPNAASHSASLAARMEGQKTPENESSPEPDVVSPQPPPRTAQSPLDVFFNAQKAENQRRVSTQSPGQSARQAQPDIRNPFPSNGKSAFFRELNSESEPMPSPRTVPPNGTQPQNAYAEQPMKNFLGVGSSAPQNVTPPQSARANGHMQSPDQQYFTPSPTQRSTSNPTTPSEHPNNYSLHYGDRTSLGPLFKAARGDTPPRPSNLRHNSSVNEQSPFNNRPQIDPDSFSRSYLDQHIRASAPPPPPQMPDANGVQYQPRQRFSQQCTPSTATNDASPRAASTANAAPTQDNKALENDLRRMLKVGE